MRVPNQNNKNNNNGPTATDPEVPGHICNRDPTHVAANRVAALDHVIKLT